MTSAIEVWRIDVRGLEAELIALDHRLGFLPAADSARIAAITEPDEARFWHAVRVAVRLIVARRAGLETARREMSIGDSGRPVLSGAGFELSIAHCRPLALLGLASVPIGIDIEAIRPVTIAPGRRLRIEAAAESVGGCVPLPAAGDARFIAAWCRIEALAKASGIGLARTLTDLGARGDGSEVMARTRTQGLAVHDLPADPGFAAALAAPAPLPDVAFEHFPEGHVALKAWLGG